MSILKYIFTSGLFLFLAGCAQVEDGVLSVKLVSPPLVHNIFVERERGTKKTLTTNKEKIEPEIIVELEQNCAFKFQGQLRNETVRVFEHKEKILAVGACVAQENERPNVGQVLPIYGKYRIRNGLRSEQDLLAMKDLLQQKCALKYKGRLEMEDLTALNRDNRDTYMLGSCHLPPKARGISSFDTVPDAEKSF